MVYECLCVQRGQNRSSNSLLYHVPPIYFETGSLVQPGPQVFQLSQQPLCLSDLPVNTRYCLRSGLASVYRLKSSLYVHGCWNLNSSQQGVLNQCVSSSTKHHCYIVYSHFPYLPHLSLQICFWASKLAPVILLTHWFLLCHYKKNTSPCCRPNKIIRCILFYPIIC